MQAMRCLLCSNDDEFEISKCIQGQLQDTEKRLAEGRVVLSCLQNQLIDVACDDPGPAIGAEVMLPILQVGCACTCEPWCGRPVSVLPGEGSGWPCQVTPWLSALHSSCIVGLKRFEARWCAALQCLRAPWGNACWPV